MLGKNFAVAKTSEVVIQSLLNHKNLTLAEYFYKIYSTLPIYFT